MQPSPLGKSRKGKSWMEDCKQLILDLSAALNNKNDQNEELLAKVSHLEHQIADLISKQQQLHANIASLQKYSREQSQANRRVQEDLRRQNQQLKLNVQSQARDLETIRIFNQQLQVRLEAKEQEVTELNSSARATKNNLSQAHSHINFLKNQLEKLRQKMHTQERQHEEELQKLRDINSSIKRQFDLMNAEYVEALNTYEVQAYRPALGTKERTKKSLPKIVRTTEMNSNQKTSDSWHKLSGNHQNPQMSQQLLKIKHQIANQYYRFSESRESVMKQRVSQTLTNIDSLLGEMECRIQEDSSSC